MDGDLHDVVHRLVQQHRKGIVEVEDELDFSCEPMKRDVPLRDELVVALRRSKCRKPQLAWSEARTMITPAR